jgi:hypothetical protein
LGFGYLKPDPVPSGFSLSCYLIVRKCAWVRERERECVCVRERECVCVCERERERERE